MAQAISKSDSSFVCELSEMLNQLRFETPKIVSFSAGQFRFGSFINRRVPNFNDISSISVFPDTSLLQFVLHLNTKNQRYEFIFKNLQKPPNLERKVPIHIGCNWRRRKRNLLALKFSWSHRGRIGISDSQHTFDNDFNNYIYPDHYLFVKPGYVCDTPKESNTYDLWCFTELVDTGKNSP